MREKAQFDIRVPSLRLILALAILIGLPRFASTVDTAALGASPTRGATEATSGSAMSVWNVAGWSADELGDIDPQVFSTALEAAQAAVERGQANGPGTLTIIDFRRPSTEKRMWVYDLRSRALLFDELVSHGRGSGQTMATSFSNDLDSHQSSLGLFRTGEAYVGKNGYSLRLDGLDRGVNDRARERGIVIHGAPYVNAAMARANGYLGRSYGCPAVRPEIARPLIDAVKGGGLLFAFGANS